MTLNVTAPPVELTAPDGIETAPLTRARAFAPEITAQWVVVGHSCRRLIHECAVLSRLLVVAAVALARLWMERRAPAQASVAEAVAPCEVGSPPGRTFDDVTDEDVAEGARRLAEAGDVSENTLRTYASALRGLDVWLSERRPGQALDDAALAEYLAVLKSRGRSVASAGQVVAAAKRCALQRGEASPAGKKTAEMLRRYRRTSNVGPGQVRGISWEEADEMRDLAAHAGDSRGLRDAALLSIMSDAMLRVSEVANVRVDDVAFEEDGTARLLVRSGKTDQTGRGEVLFLGAPTTTRVREWIAAANIREGALFRRLPRGGAVSALGIGAGSVRKVIVQRARAVGLEGRVSGHSLRVGSAQSLAKRGAGLVEMQKAGRWASPNMPAHYTRSQRVAEGAMARLRYHDGSKAPKRRKSVKDACV